MTTTASAQKTSQPNGFSSTWGHLSWGQVAVAATQLIIAVLLIYPLVSLARWMWGREYYQHFPILILAGLGLAIYRTRKDPLEFIGVSSYRVFLWTFVSLLMTVGVFTLPSRWLASLAGIALLIAAIQFVGGRQWMERMLGPLLLVAAAIPLPVNFDNWFVVALQQLATWLASVWLDLANVMHFTTGVAIQTAGQDYFVKDACSGIHSVFAAIAVGVGYGVIRGYRVRRILVLLTQLLFWVVVANAARVFLTVYGQSRLDLDLASPVYHETLGMVTFSLGVLLAISGDHFLRYLSPADDVVSIGTRGQASLSTEGWLDLPVSAPKMSAMVGISAMIGIILGGVYFNFTASAVQAKSMEEMAEMAFVDINQLQQDFLPKEIDGWAQVNFRVDKRGPESIFGGMVSYVWQYSNGTRSVLVSLDGPYDDWHDLAVCYSGTGWGIADMISIGQPDSQSEDDGFVACELTLDRPPVELAQVLYGCVDPNGTSVRPPAYFGSAFSGLVRRFGLGMLDRPGFQGGVVQLQLFDQRAGTFNENFLEENRELFWKLIAHAFPGSTVSTPSPDR